jgi:hypothetical protein
MTDMTETAPCLACLRLVHVRTEPFCAFGGVVGLGGGGGAPPPSPAHEVLAPPSPGTAPLGAGGDRREAIVLSLRRVATAQEAARAPDPQGAAWPARTRRRDDVRALSPLPDAVRRAHEHAYTHPNLSGLALVVPIFSCYRYPLCLRGLHTARRGASGSRRTQPKLVFKLGGAAARRALAAANAPPRKLTLTVPKRRCTAAMAAAEPAAEPAQPSPAKRPRKGEGSAGVAHGAGRQAGKWPILSEGERMVAVLGAVTSATDRHGQRLAAPFERLPPPEVGSARARACSSFERGAGGGYADMGAHVTE